MHQLTELLFDFGEISLAEGAVFIDGIKIEANTNRYSFVWKKRYKPPPAKVFGKIGSNG